MVFSSRDRYFRLITPCSRAGRLLCKKKYADVLQWEKQHYHSKNKHDSEHITYPFTDVIVCDILQEIWLVIWIVIDRHWFSWAELASITQVTIVSKESQDSLHGCLMHLQLCSDIGHVYTSIYSDTMLRNDFCIIH